MGKGVKSSLSNDSLNFLSKTISHALRHEPWLYELELDEEGWVSIESLLTSLRRERADWSDLSKADLIKMIASSDKKRHEINNGKIRAIYGHSLPGKLLKVLAKPPKILYHGTSLHAANVIKSEGLKPMNRQYVHLSADVKTARKVGQRKTKQPVILTVKSYDAYQAGLRFYQGNDCVWLADSVSSKFIEFQNI
jgi:putative RNA 2'-phosphotransferase